jgi:hypothetical protein
MDFQYVREFLESWGLHFDTPDQVSTSVPFDTYQLIRADAIQVGGMELQKFVSCITDTTDGETYISMGSNWGKIEEFYNGLNK